MFAVSGVVGLQSSLKTFYYLLDLVTFFDLFNSSNWDACVEVAERLSIIPPSANCTALDEACVIEHVEKFINNFKTFSDEIKQNYPQVLLCCMKVFSIRFNHVSEEYFGEKK